MTHGNAEYPETHQVLKKCVSELPERAIFHYSLTKDEEDSFGITIVGGIGSICDGIYVKTISSSGVCGRDGSLRVGDQVLELNGRCLLNVTHEEAIEVFLNCKTEIHIVVSRMVDKKPPQVVKKRVMSPIHAVTSPRQAVMSPHHAAVMSPSSPCSRGNCDEEPVILEHKPLGIAFEF